MAKAAKLAELDRPPGEVLGFDAAPKSDAECDRAISELAWIRSYAKTRRAALDMQIDLLGADHAKKLFVEISEGGETRRIAFADRDKQLESAVLSYAKAHTGDEFFAAGTQNRRFTHGVVAWRQGALSVLTLEDETDATVLEAIKEKLTIVGRLRRLLEGLKIARGVAADVAVRVKVELNKVGILAAFKSGALTNKHLQPYGCQVTRPAPEFWIDVGDYTLASASEEKRD
jgi:phage host-nuclease inhibitor protein Gam